MLVRRGAPITPRSIRIQYIYGHYYNVRYYWSSGDNARAVHNSTNKMYVYAATYNNNNTNIITSYPNASIIREHPALPVNAFAGPINYFKFYFIIFSFQIIPGRRTRIFSPRQRSLAHPVLTPPVRNALCSEIMLEKPSMHAYSQQPLVFCAQRPLQHKYTRTRRLKRERGGVGRDRAGEWIWKEYRHKKKKKSTRAWKVYYTHALEESSTRAVGGWRR